MRTPTYEIRLSYRAAFGWGFEVATIRNDGRGEGLGTWHPSRDAAERELDELELQYRGSTLKGRMMCGAD
ncbi:MAG: hypothetical protein V4653_07590 [Pseudomonadota bacterium]